MVFVYMEDPDTGRAAIFEENGTSGNPEDPNSTRNAPLNNPLAHLSKIRFHSDFDYYQVHSITTVTVNHLAVAGVEEALPVNPGFQRWGQIVKRYHTLVTHNLGYEASYMVISNGALIGQSSLIQISNSGGRRVSPCATSSAIRLLDVGTSTNQNLAAISKTYRVIVFRRTVADSPYLRDLDPANNVFVLGRGKWRGNLQQLRRTILGDASPFDVPLGRTSDIRNGVSRTVLADGTTYSHPLYNGSFSGSPSVQCTVE